MANTAEINTLIHQLQQIQNPDVNVRRPAEKYLESMEVNQGYPLHLLELIDKSEAPLPVKVIGSIVLKNFIKKNWKIEEDSGNKIHENDRINIKNCIVTLMLRSPEQIQKQLSDVVSIIGKEDFPQKWPNLLNEMLIQLRTDEYIKINGILQTAHSLFKRYRYESKSQELWTEIKLVLDNFAEPLTELFKKTMKLAETHINNTPTLKIIFSSLVLITKLFYSLNYQDLPEFFEDNMKEWMSNFIQLLNIDNKLLQTEDDEEAGLLEQIKSQIFNNVGLYAQKYGEEFQDQVYQFVNAAWGLLISVGKQVKYDLLVSNAIGFLTSVASRPQYKNVFETEGVLSSICENVIIPNMEFRETDAELFEDNPEEYMRRDIEGSDVDTRRRASCDLVRALASLFEADIMKAFSQFIAAMLQSYSNNPDANWKNKDAAIYLVTSMTIKGQTSQLGITQTRELVNINDFYRDFILPDLSNPNVNHLPVLKADAIKYVMIFRSQLPKETVVNSLPFIIRLLTSSNVIVHTYAAHCLERIFIVQNPYSIAAADVQGLTETIVRNLFTLLNQSPTENEYVMKAIMRTFSLLRESIGPYFNLAIEQLINKLKIVSKNPSKPHFNHYLFETLSLSIRIICEPNPQLVSNFEDIFFPIFEEILKHDIQEFEPYLFQILSLMLELQPTVPPTYMLLFPCLLSPILWSKSANIQPLVRLFQAYISKGSQQIVAEQKLNPVLGIFQKLIAGKVNEQGGFLILQSLLLHLNPLELEQYQNQIFVLLLQRLTSSRTTKYVKGLLVFISLFVYKMGPQTLSNILEAIRPGVFERLIEKIVIAEVQKVSGKLERKICAVGMIKLLTEFPQMLTGNCSNLWVPLLQALIGLFELPEDTTTSDDEHYKDIEDISGYQTTYSQLMFAGKPVQDPFNGAIVEPRLLLAQSLSTLSAAHPGLLTPAISANLAPEAVGHLQTYLNAAHVQLA